MILSPVRGVYRISQDFGENPEWYERFGMIGHNGQDIAVPVGTPIYAPIDGVISVGYSANGFGNYIKITEACETTNGLRRQVVLAHLSSIKVSSGNKAISGELVGLSGNTGFSTGPHLHWGLRRIKPSGEVVNAENGYYGYEDIFKKGWVAEGYPSIY